MNTNMKHYRAKLSHDKGHSHIVIAATPPERVLCKYEITFLDGSTRIKILTDAQRRAIKRRKEWDNIKTIGGLGYCDKDDNPKTYYDALGRPI